MARRLTLIAVMLTVLTGCVFARLPRVIGDLVAARRAILAAVH